MYTRREALGLTGAGLLGLYIAGCGGSGNGEATPTGTAPTATVEPGPGGGPPGPPWQGGRAGGRVVVSWQDEGNSYDPVLGWDFHSWDVLTCLCNAPLLAYGGTRGGPEPHLAADMPEISDDGREYRIRLRDGAKFHNGRDVTAEDFKYSWERALDPDVGSWAASYLYAIEGAKQLFERKAKRLRGVQVVDDQTLTIRLRQPDATFVNLLAQPYMAPVPREEVERHGDAFPRNVVGTGPFALEEYDSRGQRAVFRKNEDYFWDGIPYVDEVEYRWGVEPQLQLLQLQRGEIDVIGDGIAASLVARVTAQPQLEEYVVPVELNAVRWIDLNTTRKPFDDPRVRQALNYAVDREALARITHGEAEPWGAPLPKSLDNYRRVFEPYGHDLDRARQLLQEAGVSSFSATFLTDGSDPWPQLAQILQQQWAEIGFEMEIQRVGSSAFGELTTDGKADLWHTQWYMVQPTALDILAPIYTSDGSYNLNGYENPDVDRLVRRAQGTLDEAERNDVIAEAEAVIGEDAPGVYIANLNFLTARNPELENFHYRGEYGTYYDRLWRAA